MVRTKMRTGSSTSVPADTSLRKRVYDSLRAALTAGRFVPGEKLTFRTIAEALGVSLTPVREALRRLVAEGAFEMQPGRSVRVPLMTKAKALELCGMRVALEGLATAEAAEVATKAEIAQLRRIAREILVHRRKGNQVGDREQVRAFHFAVYAIARQPTLLRVIESLWLQTGPYMNLLYPEFIATAGGPARRLRVIEALAARDSVAARREIENDVHKTLTYVASLADAAGNIVPTASPAVGAPRGKVKAAKAAQRLRLKTAKSKSSKSK
jgi:DNA-binding GntR family transcriptional regulator